MPDIETIKRAILSNCGGWNGATDGEFVAKWNSLPPELQYEYLGEQPKPKGKSKSKEADAVDA